MKTAFTATRLAIAAFIVPYIFAMNPAMLFIDTTPIQVVSICITAIIGIFGVAAGLSGYLIQPLNMLLRLLCVAGGLTLLIPGTVTDVIGVVLLVIVIVLQKMKEKKA